MEPDNEREKLQRTNGALIGVIIALIAVLVAVIAYMFLSSDDAEETSADDIASQVQEKVEEKIDEQKQAEPQQQEQAQPQQQETPITFDASVNVCVQRLDETLGAGNYTVDWNNPIVSEQQGNKKYFIKAPGTHNGEDTVFICKTTGTSEDPHVRVAKPQR